MEIIGSQINGFFHIERTASSSSSVKAGDGKTFVQAMNGALRIRAAKIR